MAIYLERSDLLIWSVYLCFINRICYLPLDITYPSDYLNYIIKDAKPDTIVTSSKFINMFPKEVNIIIIECYSDL